MTGVVVGLSAPAAPAITSMSGLRGVVMRGPLTPVCVVERPCFAPARRVVVRFSSDRVVRSTKTDEHGRYEISLAPGRYTVRVGKSGAFKPPQPRVVRVRAGVVARIDLYVDTGIR